MNYARGLRRLRGQHDAAGQPAARQRRRAAADRRREVPQHRRPADAPRTSRWNWYSGGWDDAEAGHPGPLFQYHHQPFNYFADYAPGKPGRAHLQDETEFIAAAQDGTLPTVSFVKPYGAENEHPGYASEPDGSDHLVDLLKTITSGPQAKDTLVVVTYDEFGGQWDHVLAARARAARRRARTTRSARAPASRRCWSSRVDDSAPASTTPSTTRRRSWRRSSTASGWSRSRPGTRRSATWDAPSRWAGARSDLPAAHRPARGGRRRARVTPPNLRFDRELAVGGVTVRRQTPACAQVPGAESRHQLVAVGEGRPSTQRGHR